MLWGWKGVISGVAVAWVAILFFLTQLEKLILRANPGFQAASEGLERILNTVTVDELGDLKLPVPRLYVFPEPTPYVLVARSLGGSGVVLLSQGLLAMLTEREIQSVLRQAALRSSSPGVIFQTFCAISVLTLKRFTPKDWSRLSPLSALRLAWFFPYLVFFQKLGEAKVSLSTEVSRDSSWFTASHKIRRTVSIHGLAKNPVAQVLDLLSHSS